MSAFNLRKCQIALERHDGADQSFVAHQILTRLATSKYLAEHFDPCCVNAASKISRSSSGGNTAGDWYAMSFSENQRGRPKI